MNATRRLSRKAIAEASPKLFENRTYKSSAQVCPRAGPKQSKAGHTGAGGGGFLGDNPGFVETTRLTSWVTPK